MPQDSSVFTYGLSQPQVPHHIARFTKRLRAPSNKPTTACSSYAISFRSRASSIAEFIPGRGPLGDLTDILNTLLQNDIPGPSLIRLETEFNHLLGRGAQFEVLGISSATSSVLQQHLTNEGVISKNDAHVLEPLRRLRNYAIKRAISRAVSTSNSSIGAQKSTHDSALALGFQLHCAKTEIEKLCYEPFRNHPNIVKLLGWGLDMDILEDESIQTPRIPLLILERAHSDLAQFMKRNGVLAPSVAKSICADIGCGLELLHSERIYHGDLKLENVLMFEEGTKWIAKLCDFGLAATANEEDTPTVEYRGTEGWRPPEADTFQMLVPRRVFQCDIFAYGLIVWAVFTGKHDSPIRGRTFNDQVASERYYYAAFMDIQNEHLRRKSAIKKRLLLLVTNLDLDSRNLEEIEYSRLHAEAQVEKEINQILIVLSSSLHTNSSLRHARPWKYLDNSEFSYRVETGRFYSLRRFCSTMNITASQSMNIPRLAILQVLRYLAALIRWLSSASHPLSMTRQIKTWLKSHKLTRKLQIQQPNTKLALSTGAYPQIYKDIHLLYTAEMFLERRWDVDGISTFGHAIGHHDLRPLMRDLLDCVETPITVFLHSVEQESEEVSARARKCALARLRSRFSQCCWDQAAKSLNLDWGLRSNVLRRTLYVTPDFSCLAWLCRGEIGRLELQSLRSDPNLIWCCVFDPSLDLPERLARFILLWESGAYIQDIFSIGKSPQTAFGHMLSVLHHSKYEAEGTHDLIRHVKRIAEMDATPSESRFFLTGRSDQLIDEGRSVEINASRTTALHEAVEANSYLGVELLIRSGFAVSALDHRGKTAFERAVSSNPSPILGLEEKNQRDRIIVLLQQGKPRPMVSALPRGWEAITLKPALRDERLQSGEPMTRGRPPQIALHLVTPNSVHSFDSTCQHKLHVSRTASPQSSIQTLQSLSSQVSSSTISQGAPHQDSSLFPSLLSLESVRSDSRSQDTSLSIGQNQRHWLAPPPRRKPKRASYPHALTLLDLPNRKSRLSAARKSLHAPATISGTFKVNAGGIQCPTPRRFRYSAVSSLLKIVFNCLPALHWSDIVPLLKPSPKVYWALMKSCCVLVWTSRCLSREESWNLRRVSFHAYKITAKQEANPRVIELIFRKVLWTLDCVLYCNKFFAILKSWLIPQTIRKKSDRGSKALSEYLCGEIEDNAPKPDIDRASLSKEVAHTMDVVYYERHTQSVTFVRPKISILEHQRLTIGLQVISQSEQYIRSDSQLFRLDLVPFINRNTARTLDQASKVKFNPSTEPVYDEGWYLRDVNGLS